jgi:hypothetical protein
LIEVGIYRRIQQVEIFAKSQAVELIAPLKAAADQSMRVDHFGPKADPLNDGCQIVNGGEK